MTKLIFAQKLLLTIEQVANLRKAFANYLSANIISANIKVSKNQISKTIQSRDFIGIILGPLLIISLP